MSKKNKKSVAPVIRNMLTSLRRPEDNTPVSTERAVNIVKMIREHSKKSKNYGFDQDGNVVDWEDFDCEPFHQFEELDTAANAMGLYLEIRAMYKDVTDPTELKEIFEEHLSVILANMPDGIAQQISRRLNGI